MKLHGKTGIGSAVGVFCLCAVLFLALVIRVSYIRDKDELHIDEGISFALTNGNWLPGKDAVPQDAWMDSSEAKNIAFSDRIDQNSMPEWKKMTESTALDVHPPLYYWLLAAMRKLIPSSHGAAAGHALNLILFIGSAVLFISLGRRIVPDAIVLAGALGIWALSPVSLSITAFIRMYDLLQFVSLAFLCSAWSVLFPKNPRGKRETAAGLSGMGVAVFLGYMTQYYFLFILFPVCVFACALLVGQKRFVVLGLGFATVLAGLAAGALIFPAALGHLTMSYRAGQSFQNLSLAASSSGFEKIAAYLAILGRGLIPWSALIVSGVPGIAYAIRTAKSGSTGRATGPGPLVLLTVLFLFSFTIIAISAPYQTARYIGAFFPLYSLLVLTAFGWLYPPRALRVALCALALVSLMRGFSPDNRLDFHEDYDLGSNTGFMRDGGALILMGTEGGTWKVPLIHANMADGKPFYSTVFKGSDPSRKIREIASGTDAESVYVAVCDYIQKQPDLELLGYYGFYYVYRAR